MTLLQEAKHLAEACREDRRQLHRHAEAGFELGRTRDYVMNRLRQMDLQPRECGRCGVVCCIGAGERTLLLRADMDALPIREESGLPFCCENGCMHACGHDMHTAMLLSAAQMLKRREAELPCRIRLMFQPAEELLLGAQDMIASGVLEGVHAAAMVHVLVGQELPVGTVIIAPPGPGAPGACFFTIDVHGSGGHGAMTGESVDPINAAAHILIALQAVNARELGFLDSAALTIGMLQAGKSANVIPSLAVMRGSLRAYDGDTEMFIRRRVEEIARDTAAAFRARAQVRFDGSCPVLLNDENMHRIARGAMGDALLPVLDAGAMAGGRRASGSEDFSHISRRVPSVMLALAAGRPSDGYVHPLHHPAVRFDENALPFGAAAYAALALGWAKEQASG